MLYQLSYAHHGLIASSLAPFCGACVSIPGANLRNSQLPLDLLALLYLSFQSLSILSKTVKSCMTCRLAPSHFSQGSSLHFHTTFMLVLGLKGGRPPSFASERK